nr:hypothetical protein [Streptomyces sp. V1I6]
MIKSIHRFGLHRFAPNGDSAEIPAHFSHTSRMAPSRCTAALATHPRY